MKSARPVKIKNALEIQKEWDNIAQHRFVQISSGKDASFTYVNLPWFVDAIKRFSPRKVIDLGCGTGILTDQVSRINGIEECLGIDISTKSISIAEEHFASDQTSFKSLSIEDLPEQYSKYPFDLAFSNLTFHTVITLNDCLAATRRILKPQGVFIFSILHPAFWPIYSGYFAEPWFEYSNEIVIEAEFKISSENKSVYTATHVHRPIERYIQGIANAGFELLELHEISPYKLARNKYVDTPRYPRFLAFICSNK